MNRELLEGVCSWIMPGKKKSKFTIMVIPHSEDTPLVFKLPITVLQLVGVILLAMVMLGISFTTRYIDMVKSLDELDALRQENLIKSGQIELLAKETQTLLEKFEEIKELEERLRLLTDDEVTNEAMESFDNNIFLTNRGVTSLERANRSLNHINTQLPHKTENMTGILSDIEENNRRLSATPSGWPTRGRITSPFGYRRNPVNGRMHHHTGIDIANSTGTPIYATANGTVSVAAYRGGYGNLIIIEHGYGYSTYYAHLSRISVRPFQQVSRGQLIGYMGSTGQSTGPHLHYEVRVRGNPVNPRNYLN